MLAITIVACSMTSILPFFDLSRTVYQPCNFPSANFCFLPDSVWIFIITITCMPGLETSSDCVFCSVLMTKLQGWVNPTLQVLWASPQKLASSARWGYIKGHVSSVAQSCPTLCDPMNRSTPGPPIHHQLLEFTQTHVNYTTNPCA